MGAEATEEQVWAYLGNYVEDARADKYPELAGLIRNALAYNRDFIAPTLLRRKPAGVEVAALERLDRELAALAPDAAAEDTQTIGYTIGKEGGCDTLREWFKELQESIRAS